MNDKRLRLLVLTQGGCELALNRLLELECAEIAGIFIETDIIRRRSLREKVARSVKYDGYAATLGKFARRLLGAAAFRDQEIKAISESRDRLGEIARQNGVPVHLVDNYHSETSLRLMREADSDLGIVLGTNILKESVFAIPRLGSINLHQGLAPYYRGGPSVFWELSNGEREVGLTVHFVAPKVDTGDIVLQRTVPLEYDYSYRLDYQSFIRDYRQKLKVPSANLVAEAVRVIADGSAVLIPQQTDLGKRYRLPTKKQKDELRRRLIERRRLQTFALAQKSHGGD